jgi:transposase-like protein
MARIPDPKRHALWRDRIRRQVASGMTITRFCDQEQIAASAFHAWKRRFQLMQTQDPSRTVPAPAAFLPVTVRVLESAAGQSPPIEADLPNGVCLRIPTANASLACRLVRAVSAAKTRSGGSR